MYATYRFKHKDPIIDVVRTVVHDSGLTYVQIANKSGVTTNTLRNWFFGGTKRPQHATIAAVVHACGYTITIARNTDKTNVVPMRKTGSGSAA